ncbi:MAG: hypothetical protein AAF368_05540 [Planctomycetota bacterium]
MKAHLIALGLCAGVASTACDGATGGTTTAKIETVRTVSQRNRPALAGATTQERLGRTNITAPRKSPFAWDLPSGWSEKAATSMRQGNFAIDARPAVEAYLTLLPGDAGGLAANVNRWRKQMGQAPLDEAAVRSLPTVKLLGQPAIWIELIGDFTGMGGASVENSKLAGTILEFPQGSVFLKMTGPRADVDAELPAFRSLIASLRIAREEGEAERTQSEDAGGSPSSPKRFDPRALEWAKPDGWEEVQASTMRLASFNLDDDGSTECYLTVLGGDGGGVQANFDRWNTQLGHGALTPKEIAEFDRVTVLGQDVPVFQATGQYSGMMSQGSAKPDYGMLGTMVTLGESSLFIKLIGPADVVNENRSRFFEFVASLNAGS